MVVVSTIGFRVDSERKEYHDIVQVPAKDKAVWTVINHLPAFRSCCQTTVSILLLSCPGSKLIGHCLDMPVVGYLQTACIEHCGKFLQYKIYFIHIEYSLKSTERGCDRYPSVNGTLITSTLVRMGPGNPGWTPVVSQQVGFPCQMLLEGFLGCHPSVPP